MRKRVWFEHEIFAELQVQDVRHGVGVGDGGDGAAGQRRFEQQPGIRGVGDGILKCEMRAAQEGGGRARMRGLRGW